MFSTTVHGIKRISAATTRTAGAPLEINFRSFDGNFGSISLFTDDQDATDRYVAAINAVTEQLLERERAKQEAA